MKPQDVVVDTNAVTMQETGHSGIHFLASPELTGSRSLAFLRGTVEGGGNIHLHAHADTECFYILEGEMEMYQDLGGKGAWQKVRQGELALIGSNVKHARRNTSSLPCVCLIITGGDVFRYLLEVIEYRKDALQQGTPPRAMLKKIKDLATETHGWFATPEENAAIGLKFR